MIYQLTVIKLEEYGQWTLTLGSDREYQLQILQSNIYADLQDLFSNKNGVVFFNRFDEFIALSNRINIDEHRKIYEIISKKYGSIKFSMSIGTGETPLKSSRNSQFIKNKMDYNLNPFIYGNWYPVNDSSQETQINFGNENNDVKILHIDINNSKDLTKNLSSYEITNIIIKLYSTISDVFLKEECLTFYLGGDNFMIIAKDSITIERVKEIIDSLIQSTKINLNCGIGTGDTGRKAAEIATKSLDLIREFRRHGKIINVYGHFD